MRSTPCVRLPAAAGLALLTVFATAAIVSAHAQYESSNPAENSTVPAAPSTVRVTFTQELRSVTINVTGPTGATVSTGSATIDLANRKNASVPLRAAGPGSYQVAWSTVSDEDGEEANGTFAFSAGAAAPAPGAPSQLPRTGEAAPPSTVPLALLGALLVAVGLGVRALSPRRA